MTSGRDAFKKKQAQMTCKLLLPLSCDFLRIMFVGPLIVLLELKLKPPLTIPDSSDNFRLIDVIPDVPLVVPLDLCLGVHLEVLTFSDPT